MISSPCLFTVRVCVAVSCDCSLVCFSISAICWRCCDGAEISIPRMMSRISDWVREATFTLDKEVRRRESSKHASGTVLWNTNNTEHNLVDYLLVLFTVVCQDEIFELHFDFDPFLISECGPDVMGLSDRRLVGFQDHLCTIIVHMKGSEDQDKSWEGLKKQNKRIRLCSETSTASCSVIFNLILLLVGLKSNSLCMRRWSWASHHKG